MDQQQLHDDLLKLQTELREVSTLDEREREALARLASQIEALLAKHSHYPQEFAPEYAGLRDQLHQNIASLEASHPQLTLLMRNIIDSLAYLGI